MNSQPYIQRQAQKHVVVKQMRLQDYRTCKDTV